MDEKLVSATFTAEGIPSVYANHATVSMSYVDIRVFLSEISPKELNLEPVGMKPAEPLINTRLALVMSPEFAKMLLDSLSSVIQQYEAKFGHLRPNPNPVPPAAATPPAAGKKQ